MARSGVADNATGGCIGQQGAAAGGVPDTALYLKDFKLVAEAAKRAQIACLARDMDEVGL